MKTRLLFAVAVLPLFICTPRAKAQSVPDVGPYWPTWWLLKSEYCVPSDCFDYELGQNVTASTTYYGACNNGANLVVPESISALDCSQPIGLETQGSIKTGLIYHDRTPYGKDGLEVDAQGTENGVVVSAGFNLQWCDGTFSSGQFPAPC